MISTRIRLAAASTAALCALAGIAVPAHAATIGTRAADGTCTVTLTAGEQKYASELTTSPDPKLGLARDRAAAIEQVFPKAKATGDELVKGLTPETRAADIAAVKPTDAQRTALLDTGLPENLIAQYVDAKITHATQPRVVQTTAAPELKRVPADARESQPPPRCGSRLPTVPFSTPQSPTTSSTPGARRRPARTRSCGTTTTMPCSTRSSRARRARRR